MGVKFSVNAVLDELMLDADTEKKKFFIIVLVGFFLHLRHEHISSPCLRKQSRILQHTGSISLFALCFLYFK